MNVPKIGGKGKGTDAKGIEGASGPVGDPGAPSSAAVVGGIDEANRTDRTKPEPNRLFADISHEKATRELYEAYCAAVEWKAFNGDPLPDWMTFRDDANKQKQVKAWAAAGLVALEVPDKMDAVAEADKLRGMLFACGTAAEGNEGSLRLTEKDPGWSFELAAVQKLYRGSLERSLALEQALRQPRPVQTQLGGTLGALRLHGDRRIMLSRISGYEPGGDCAVIFHGSDGKEIGRWEAPEGRDGKPLSKQEREKCVKHVLGCLDRLFDADQIEPSR